MAAGSDNHAEQVLAGDMMEEFEDAVSVQKVNRGREQCIIADLILGLEKRRESRRSSVTDSAQEYRTPESSLPRFRTNF